eukprot:5466298-Pleurochrysis_carterae.AAC.2
MRLLVAAHHAFSTFRSSAHIIARDDLNCCRCVSVGRCRSLLSSSRLTSSRSRSVSSSACIACRSTSLSMASASALSSICPNNLLCSAAARACMLVSPPLPSFSIVSGSVSRASRRSCVNATSFAESTRLSPVPPLRSVSDSAGISHC